MFGFLKSLVSKKELSSLDQKLSSSFQGVKSDTSTLFEWVKYLNSRFQQQQISLDQINNKLSKITVIDDKETKEAIKNISILHQRLNETINYCHFLGQKTDQLLTKIDEKTPKQSFKQRLIKKITRNSKDYVKTVILNMISKYEGVNSVKLREIVVEEQGLCSKSSFYRTLSDLERDREVDIKHSGPDRLYFPRLIKKV